MNLSIFTVYPKGLNHLCLDLILNIQVSNLKLFIFNVRGVQVMLDSDLALCYGIEVKRLNESVKRNIKRFPEDFMFQLTEQECEVLNLRSQFATTKWNMRRNLPYAFTEQGVAMLSGVINSDQAIQVNINIMRTFTAMRRYFAEQKDMGTEIKKLEKVLLLHIDNTDGHLADHAAKINDIITVLDEMRKLPPPAPKRKIGFGQN